MRIPAGKGAVLLIGLLILFAQGAHAAPITFTHYNNPGLFTDISGTGAPLNLNDDSVEIIATTIGNAIFGAGTVVVGNNGGIGYDASSGLAFANAALPAAGAFSNATALLPFWNDIDEQTGNVYWQELGGALIVQWHNRPHFLDIGSATFQLQLFSAGSVLARYVYQDVDFGSPPDANFGASATIGYQVSSTEAYQYSFDSAVLANGDVIDITLTDSPEPGTLLLTASGLLAALAVQRARRRA